MDERIYYSLLAAFFALQSQFSTIIEDRHNQLQDVDDDGNQWKRLLQENSDFAKLTELEQRSIELEEDLRRAMLEAFSSRHGMQYGRRFLRLWRNLRRLQAYLRTEMEPLNRWSSLQYHKQTFLRHKKKQMSLPFRVRSLPDLLNSSELTDVVFEIIKGAQSLNITILFKKDTLEDLHGTLRIRLENLENMLEDQRQAHGTMNPTQRERQPPRPTQHLHQRVFSIIDLTWTGTQHQPLHLRQTVLLRRPAPPTVNPAQTERWPGPAPRGGPTRLVDQLSARRRAVGSSSAQLENQSRHSTRTMTRAAAPSNSSPPSSWNSISTAMCKMLVVICTAVLPFI